MAKPKRTANPVYVAAMQGLRRSNTTTPVPSGKTYRRKTRTARQERGEE
jgi:hypothetical protein